MREKRNDSSEENLNRIKDFNELYDAVGWGHYSEEIVKKSLKNTFYSVSVYDDAKIIGYGRIIGDAICFLYIQDIMVIPDYQNQKIGTTILKKLLEKVKEIQKMSQDFLSTLQNCREITFKNFKEYSKVKLLIGRILRLFGPLL